MNRERAARSSACRVAEASRRLDEAFKQFPNDAFLHYLMGSTLSSIPGQQDRSLAELKKLDAEIGRLIEADDELGRLAPGYLADIVAVRGDVSRDIACTLDMRFVMKDGTVYKRLALASWQGDQRWN